MTKYSSYILYMLIAIFVVILFINDFGPVDTLQKKVNDLLSRASAPSGLRQNIVLVMIDGKAQDTYGSWPWDYDLIADVAAAAATAKPKAIMIDFPLSENASQDSAGHTDVLSEQLAWIDNIVLPYDIAVATYRRNITSNPKKLFYNSILTSNPVGVLDEDASLQVRKVFLPADKLLNEKPHLGFVYDSPDEDRTLRRQPLVMNYEGYYYPSLTLLAAATYLGVPPEKITFTEKESIKIGGERNIPINGPSEFFIRFSKGNSFMTYSAADLLAEGFDLNKLAGKLVIIGVDNMAGTEYFATPVKENVTPLWVHASVVENIINRNLIVEAKEKDLTNLLALFLLGGICAFMLPRVSLLHRFLILFGLAIVLANINYFMVSSLGIIPETVYIGLELLLFMIASPMLDSRFLTGEKPSTAAPMKARVPGRSKGKSGSDKQEKPPIREIIASVNDTTNVKTSALTPEQADRTTATASGDSLATSAVGQGAPVVSEKDKPIRGGGKPPVDDYSAIKLDDDKTTPESLPEITSSDNDWSGNSSQVNFQNTAQNITNLGRYQVVGVLGKGAMGLVYKGVDPAINRPVALKTIRLDFVNDPEEMEELKERLFREAQAAGKLSHPNIVTIYDVGSEDQLQYIAMEYLEGQTLEDLIKKKVKFNYRIFAQLITKICNALDYAHEQGIVHRDIKPANIMVQKDYSPKVMDYGIARIDSHSMTKTGIAMGTPNYISPEQLKGLPIDRRADIFSLGVVMYEMLLGRRPFKGENITSLIYSILNHEPEKPSNLNPQVPLLFDHIVGKALQKDPKDRYQKASEITTDLADFVESFASH